MLTHLRPALVSLAFFTAVTGVAYPLVVTGIAQVAFAKQANGSLVEKDDKVVGSRLIGRLWDDPKHFWGRPSATVAADGKALPYNGGASAGSNLGPTNPQLADAVRARIEALHVSDPDNAASIPVDLVTTSGSGLDPDISPAAADWQVRRVARARDLDEARVRRLVAEHTSDRQLGLLGEPRVNVLTLNLALDDLR